MPTISVTTAEVHSFAAKLVALGRDMSALGGGRVGGGACFDSGAVAGALDHFQGHWANTLAVVARKLDDLGTRLDDAAAMYEQTEGDLVRASIPAAAGGGGGGDSW